MIARFHALPIRWKLATSSAALTFAILALFAVVIGLFAGRQVRAGFDDDLRAASGDLQNRVGFIGYAVTREVVPDAQTKALISAAGAGEARIRILDRSGTPLFGSPANLGGPGQGIHDVGPYRVVVRPLYVPGQEASGPIAYLQYAKPLAGPHHTIKEIRIFLAFGVLGGTMLALMAGLAIARRAIAPIANLTRAADHIAHTRDPAIPELPKPKADDEVADLARTLEQMLLSLGAAQGETEAALARQREFVADASHELRTPLTSVLANLELLEQSLTGEDHEIAESALRSSRRMRRLVADLLLLARADAGRVATRQSVDLAGIARDAAAEAAPLAGEHELTVALPDPDDGSPRPVVHGSPDDLHRLVLNLLQNAISHTPDGTLIDVTVSVKDGEAVLEVADDGPGIPPELRARIFERFVRGAGDARRGGSGLGLAIVQAVAQSHLGTVELAGEDGRLLGTRFVVRLPLVPGAPGSLPPTVEHPAAHPA
jgi:signal transduction histidine kinase